MKERAEPFVRVVGLCHADPMAWGLTPSASSFLVVAKSLFLMAEQDTGERTGEETGMRNKKKRESRGEREREMTALWHCGKILILRS